MAAHQAPPSMGFSRQEYWSGVPPGGALFICAWHFCLHVCEHPHRNALLRWLIFLSLLLLLVGGLHSPLIPTSICPGMAAAITSLAKGALSLLSPPGHSRHEGQTVPLQVRAAAKSFQSCPTLCDPRDGSPPGSSVPGILQARTLEWVAISFSNA